jgi:predicted dehydrogenase
MIESSVRIALIGCGDSTARYQNVENRLLDASFTLVSESLESALAKHDDEFDALIIQTSLPEREVLIRMAADAGKHMIVQGPFCTSSTETLNLVNYCSEAKVSIATSGSLHFSPANQKIMKAKMDEQFDTIGEPGVLRVHRWQNGDADLYEKIYLDIDLASSFFSSMPSEICVMGKVNADTGNPDYLQVHFGYDSGAMAVFNFSRSLPAGQDYDSLSLIGSRGAIYCDDHRNTHLLYKGGNPAALISSTENLRLINELNAFVNAIHHPAQEESSADFYCSHLVLEAIMKSFESGQVAHLKGASYELI